MLNGKEKLRYRIIYVLCFFFLLKILIYGMYICVNLYIYVFIWIVIFLYIFGILNMLNNKLVIIFIFGE